MLHLERARERDTEREGETARERERQPERERECVRERERERLRFVFQLFGAPAQAQLSPSYQNGGWGCSNEQRGTWTACAPFFL